MTYSRLVTSAHEIDAIVSMLKPLMSVALEFQEQFKKALAPTMAKAARAIASVPDDVLAIIFEAAVRAEKSNGPRQAIRLSHVSRRFRQVALEEHNLWTTLRSNASKEELETFVSRSGTDTDFHVFVHVCPKGGMSISEYEFMKKFETTMSRWKTLSLNENSGVDFNDKSEIWFCAEHILGKLGEVQLPRLQELYILSGDVRRSRKPYSWVSPNLRYLRFQNYAPSPSAVMSSVTTLSFTHHLIPRAYLIPADRLLTLLASLPSLSNFELGWYCADTKLNESKPLPLPIECPVITSLHLRLLQFPKLRIPREEDRAKEWYIAAFLRAMHMPQLEDLTISIDFEEMGDTNENERAELLADLSRAVLPAQVADPLARLASLNYNLTCSDWKDASIHPRYDVQRTFPTIFTIPLDRIPTVSTLTMTTCTRMHFTREKQVGAYGVSEACRLRDVRFIGCRGMEIDEFQSAVQSLRDIDAWETTERVVVEDCLFSCFRYLAALRAVEESRLPKPSGSEHSPLLSSNRFDSYKKLSQVFTPIVIEREDSKPDDEAPFEKTFEKKAKTRGTRKVIANSSDPKHVFSSNRFSILEDDNDDN